MVKEEDIQNNFKQLSAELEKMSKKIDSLIPKAIIKEATNFGNSSHIVLSRNFLNKKVGVIIFSEEDKMKGGDKEWYQ